MKWVQAGLIVRVGLERGRLIDEDMIEFERKMLSSDKSCYEEVRLELALELALDLSATLRLALY